MAEADEFDDLAAWHRRKNGRTTTAASFDEDAENGGTTADEHDRLLIERNPWLAEPAIKIKHGAETGGTLVVAVGKSAAARISPLLETASRVATCVFPSSQTERNPVAETSKSVSVDCSVWRISKDLLVSRVVGIKDEFGIFEWVKTVMTTLAPTSVRILDTMPRGNYSSVYDDEDHDDTIFRSVRTSFSKPQAGAPPLLEPSNKVLGASAAYVTYCEAFEIDCTLLLAVSSQPYNSRDIPFAAIPTELEGYLSLSSHYATSTVVEGKSRIYL
ncbi:hypothetical protein DFJ73DRAFT_816415 [Zopfochytrium polystomum]|nr:hypothetical protein DFJ73DRAFT_816415 [Zopfochytrium polystomum]